MTFYGYQRPDGRVGVRNKVLILPASVCASDTARIIAQQVEGAVTFNNQLGCFASRFRPAVCYGCNGGLCRQSEYLWNSRRLARM